MAENATLRAEDLVPVRSRVSWGAHVLTSPCTLSYTNR
jgi:hypothetical protein